ncbi:MAG: radical SAM protein, partial [Vicinamibacteria bacterium]
CYLETERVTEDMLEGYDTERLLCTHSRVVTSRGVYVCPILIDSPEARLGASLSESLGSFPLAHGACYTCYLGGAICANPSAGAGNVM